MSTVTPVSVTVVNYIKFGRQMGDWVRLNSDKMMVRVEQVHDALLTMRVWRPGDSLS